MPEGRASDSRFVTSRLGAKSQTVVPKEVRAALGIGPGDQIGYSIQNGRVILSAIKRPSAPDDPFACFDDGPHRPIPRAMPLFERRAVRRLLLLMFATILVGMPALSSAAEEQAAPQPVPSILVLDLEMVDTSGEPTDQRQTHERRLQAIRAALETELAARGVYAVVDPAEIRADIDVTRARQSLHACNGCELRLARVVDADRVLTGQVNKVSSLVLSLWVDIKDAHTGRPVARKVLDFRGDNDQGWQRATDYLVREIERLPPDAR
jgi:hypothetical protein